MSKIFNNKILGFFVLITSLYSIVNIFGPYYKIHLAYIIAGLINPTMILAIAFASDKSFLLTVNKSFFYGIIFGFIGANILSLSQNLTIIEKIVSTQKDTTDCVVWGIIWYGIKTLIKLLRNTKTSKVATKESSE
jgi:hypothetical protein